MSNSDTQPMPTPGLNKQQLYANADQEARNLLAETYETPNKGLFILQSATRWMDEARNEPDTQMLFGEFWHEGELCILFVSPQGLSERTLHSIVPKQRRVLFERPC